jgi:hypothetical protein
MVVYLHSPIHTFMACTGTTLPCIYYGIVSVLLTPVEVIAGYRSRREDGEGNRD